MSWGMSLQAFIPCAPPPPLIRHYAELRRSFSTPLCDVVFYYFYRTPFVLYGDTNQQTSRRLPAV